MSNELRLWRNPTHDDGTVMNGAPGTRVGGASPMSQKRDPFDKLRAGYGAPGGEDTKVLNPK